eukprot:c21811_g1_i3 orf=232-2304(+)
MQKRGPNMATVVGRGEREEELALFHEVRRRERERKSNAVHPLPHDADQPHLGSAHTRMQHRLTSAAAKLTSIDTSNKPVYDPISADLTKKGDDLLTAELGKNDYDWLLTPPGTPLINPSDHNSASNGDDFLSRADPLSSIRSLAAIKTSRFSSSKTEPNLKKEGATLLAKPDLALRKGQNGLSRSSGLTGSSSYTTNNATTKKTPGSRPSSRPTSPTKRSTIPSTHTSHPTTPTSRPKPPSTPRSHPTTPTNRLTPALTSRSGSNSFSPSSMISGKAGACSPATTPIRRLAGPQTPTHQPLSAGVSRSPSISKARPLPSRSAPSSRGSSPTAKPYVWQQGLVTPAFSLGSQSLNGANLTILPNMTNSRLTAPNSMNSRGSPVGSSSRPGTTTSTTQAAFSSLNHSGTSLDVTRKACSPSLTRGKSSLLSNSRTDSSASLSMSRNSSQMDKSLGDIVARNTKVGDKMLQSRRPLGSSLSPDTTWSVLQTKHLREKSASPASSRENGISSKQVPRRSLDMTLQSSNLRRNTSNGLCSLVSSTPVSSLFSARHTKMQACSNDLSIASYSNASADYSMMTLRDQEGSELSEEFLCGSDFQVSPARQSELSMSLGKDAHVNNWLGIQENMDEGLDLMQAFEQGVDKYESCESPLVCPHGGGAANCDLCNVKMRLQMLNEKSKASFGAISQIVGEA